MDGQDANARTSPPPVRRVSQAWLSAEAPAPCISLHYHSAALGIAASDHQRAPRVDSDDPKPLLPRRSGFTRHRAGAHRIPKHTA
jgi:hypothetical protein